MIAVPRPSHAGLMNSKNSYSLDKALIRRAFDRAAPTYDGAAALQEEVGRRLMERLHLMRSRPGTILDLGCGTGLGVKGLHSLYRGARVTALDLSEAMLHRTRNRLGWRWRSRWSLVCGDQESLPFASGTFDLIFSNLSLQWCTDTDGTLSELLRVLRPGGALMFTTFGPDTLHELRRAWADVDSRTHVHRFMDMHDVGDALLHSGFAEPVVDVEHLTLTYTELPDLLRDLKRVGAQNQTQGRPRTLTGRSAFRQLRLRYESFRSADGLLPATYEVVYGHAWRAPEIKGAREPRRSGETRIPVTAIRRKTRREES